MVALATDLQTAKDEAVSTTMPAAATKPIAAVVSSTMPAIAGEPDPSLDPKANLVRNNLFDQMLHAAEDDLSRHPPAFPMPMERRLPLLAIDGVLNDPYAIQRQPIQAFFHRRFKLAVDQIAAAKVAPGAAAIWHIYNMGFVVKTSTATMAFDLIAPSHLGALQVSAETMRAMVDQCDVLFISHLHQDHADPVVAKMFVESGKPVVGPVELETIDAIYQRALHFPPSVEKSYKIQLSRSTVDAWIFPGQQEIKPAAASVTSTSTFVQNNVYLVQTQDHFSVAHDGDLNDFASWQWIDRVHELVPHVDVLIYNSWVNPIGRYLKGFNPSLVLLAHTNELGHRVESRFPYWRAMDKAEKAKVPAIVMAWGESVDYPLGH